MTVLIAKPRGFCAGVDRAVDIVKLTLELYGPPVYMRHQIVHNRYVVEKLTAKGAVFTEQISEIPEGSVAVFSAHGVSPAVWEEARKRKLRIIDATCPLVTKVHLEVKRYAREGYAIILIGHRGHVEMEGTIGEAPQNVTLIETLDEARTISIPTPERCVILTQTTLSIDDTAMIIAALKDRFPAVTLPPKEDICYATTNRQQAVKELAKRCDLVLAIGAPESSNTTRLREVAEKEGAMARLIQCATDLRPEWFVNIETVGITAGASAPEELVTEVVNWFRQRGATPVEEIAILEEDIRFVLPSELVNKAREKGLGGMILQKHSIK